ncbi:Toll/interleukin-1 receptor homology (TIR) domain [Arabidopsis suecica]|uniref:ADP-ribosyl cyclase/cyclic ADP-ribose hydrolase n=1 Tax=Arabidopsis suecica TaxID=45249 RepID=A0A8T1ZVT2_ARASU|nr:Toll/interleukin-1 receptor homology (TIR) domain [Arabidopsis suecica]
MKVLDPLFTLLMNPYFFLGIGVAAIGFFMLFRIFRFQQENKEIDCSSASPSPASPSSSSHNWTHQVFPSFRGEDVRRNFLSHIQKEFQRKRITLFVDNEIKRGESIGPKLIQGIKGSKIALVLLSKNYASSSWCLDELVEIMKCKEELGQTVLPIFYKVDPSDVKKLTGKFGSAFKSICAGKRNEVIRKWRQALAKVATTTGYSSRNWDNEADMIEKIASDILKMLNYTSPSRDFGGLIGMEAHMKEMEQLLCLDSDEVRMIGICGPSGIGKTTIARVLFNQFNDRFELSAFVENIKELMDRPLCSDDYSTKLYIQKQFMSQITNYKEIEIRHLGVAQDMLHDKKVLVVLDSINQSIQLDAIAKETCWFGQGSRIIITTQDQKLLKAHDDINHIYKVGFPSAGEACQIFCMYAFGKKFPKDGFEDLTWQVTKLLGGLPLGLRVMGSHFRGMSKNEWINALPRLKTRLDSSIQSILKFSYDALCDEDKDLFLYIACLFNNKRISKVEEHLAHKFLDLRQGLYILAEKSLISIDTEWIKMHNLLEQLGKEIVRHEPGHQSICDPGKRQLLVDARDICEVLTDDTGSSTVIGIHFDPSELLGELNISEGAFEGMSNLKFLRFKCTYGDQSDKLYLPKGLRFLSPKLRLLQWGCFPMSCLPSNFCTKYLVELNLRFSKLHKLWEGNLPLKNLKWMVLSYSKNLKELPNLSTATKLQELFLIDCTSLVELPSSIGNAISLQTLHLGECKSIVELPSYFGNAINLSWLNLSGCSSLVELPSSIGNATNIEILHMDMCTNLVKLPSSIGNLYKLKEFTLKGCLKLEILPTNINLESLDELNLTDCLLLKRFPEISTNIKHLYLNGTAVEEVPSSIKSWSRLDDLHMSYSESLKKFPHALDIITTLYVNDLEMHEIPLWVTKISCLRGLKLNRCKKLVSLPQLPDSLSYLEAVNCESLERLDFSFYNPKIYLNFVNCFKLNKEARELIIQTSTDYAVLPGREVPAKFTYRANIGNSMIVNLNDRPLSTTSRFKACILLVNKGDKENEANRRDLMVSYRVMDKHNLSVVPCSPTYHFIRPPTLAEHLYTFEFEEDVTSNEHIFEFKVDNNEMVIKECGVLQP